MTPQALRERAASYRDGCPSSEHTAKMLEDAAAEIERLRKIVDADGVEMDRLRGIAILNADLRNR